MREFDQEIKNINLCKARYYYPVRWDDLDSEAKGSLERIGYCAYEDVPLIYIWSLDLDRSNISMSNYSAVLWEAGWEDEEEFATLMHRFVKPANHYLVYASGCRWNGASGYTITNGVVDTVSRPYDCTITPISQSKGHKTLRCRESSHDVPMGSSTYIIALTDREYEVLTESDFAGVQRFLGRCIGEAI